MSRPVPPADVEELIRRFEASGFSELHVRIEGFELYLSSDPDAEAQQQISVVATAAPVTAPAKAAKPSPAKAAPASFAEGLEIIRAPYQGAFYRAPKPGEPAFVEIGSVVGVETDLCIIEVMKLFTAVRAGMAGTVVDILAEDGEMVEQGRPLFALQPPG